MAVTVGQQIGETQYTTLRSGMLTVMGTPTGTGTGAAGYLQTTTAPSVTPGDKITAAQWNALSADVTKAYTHQVGSAPSPALATVNTDSGITAAIHNSIETTVTYITANRFTMNTAQSTLSTASNKTKTNWNGVQIHDVQFTWASANEVKAFFNAGGTIKIASTLAYTGTDAKTLDWKRMVTDAADISINYVSAYKDGGGTAGTIVNNDGYYDLNTTERQLLQYGGTNPYSENDYQIWARSITNGVRIRVFYRDDDVGDQKTVGTGGTDGKFLPLGAAVDENVQGTLTSTLYYRRATGSSVSVAAPSISLGATNTF